MRQQREAEEAGELGFEPRQADPKSAIALCTNAGFVDNNTQFQWGKPRLQMADRATAGQNRTAFDYAGQKNGGRTVNWLSLPSPVGHRPLPPSSYFEGDGGPPSSC